MNKSFIFDIDGTLVDSNDFHALAWQKAFQQKGKSISLKQIRPHIGLPNRYAPAHPAGTRSHLLQ